MHSKSDTLILAVVLALAPGVAYAKSGGKQQNTLSDYLAQLPQLQTTTPAASPGSLWIPGAGLAVMAADYKARNVGDIVTVTIDLSTTAASKGSVNAARNFSASSGISALAGQINTAGIEQLFSPQSASALQGQGQTASSSMLQTRISGLIVAVLPGNGLVVQAEREVLLNNEKETLVLRGVARPGDVGPDNSVSSSLLANLQIEVKGKGVISDSTRQPNLFVRLLLKLVGF